MAEEKENKIPVDFSKMRVGLRMVNDITIDVGSYKKIRSDYGDKQFVLQAMSKQDNKTMRAISQYFYQSNGVYKRLCEYLAYLYRYDWYVDVYLIDEDKVNKNKLLKDFAKVLEYMDNSNLKLLCGNVALAVMRDGCYYGTLVEFEDSFGIQQLPSDYCRCRYTSGAGLPVVEFNVKWFDDRFADAAYRMKVLSTFSKDIQKGYVLYKQNKLPQDYPGDTSGWLALDPQTSIKFTPNGNTSGSNDFPPLIGVIPSIIDLDEAQELDRKKTMQQLLKILVQKLPLDKNGDLIFDVDEALDIHKNAKAMLQKAVGVEVLTTFADIEKIDTKDSNSNTSTDDLEKVERTVFNNSGISRNLFNAEGNLATTNSILTDEADVRGLILQFQTFLTRVAKNFSRRGQYRFGVSILETTQYNYRDLAKLYESHTKIGFSKILPQIALGRSQSSILGAAQFENDILHLADVMLPPMSSNTMSSSLLGKNNSSNSNNSQNQGEGKAGRPEKDETEKSDKTIANGESAT